MANLLDVARHQQLHEAARRAVDGVHLVAHAGAGVEQEDDVQRNALRLEEADVLHHAVFVDFEVLLAEAQSIRSREAVRETRSLNLPQVSTGTPV